MSRDSGVGVRVDGARQLRAALKKAGKDLEDLKEAHTQAAGMVTERARGTAPHRTGRLAATVRGSGTKTQGVIRAGYATVPYAGPIHWGWPARGIDAQPWISEAAVDLQPRWVAAYEEHIDRIVEDLAASTTGVA